MSVVASYGRGLWRWISGLGLATSLLVTLGVLTWLATLEMVDAGLLATLRKYFHWTSWYLVPEINGKSLMIPLPGGYWVCALLLVNLTLGGLVRVRKGWKTIGVVVAHFGMIFMVAAGGVAQWMEERGVMFLVEGESADFAVSLNEPSIEIMEIEDGKVSGEVRVTRGEDLTGLDPQDQRRIRLPELPFDLELSGWQENAVVRPAPEASQGVDGWAISRLEGNEEGELDSAATYAVPVFEDGSRGERFILAIPPSGSGMDSYAPETIRADGREFAVRMVKQTIPVPFQVKLIDAVANYYPNTARPESFMSDIERIADDGEPVEVRIQMNEPLRQGGFTFFQRNMGAGMAMRDGPEYSGFEVVHNPADRWPEYSLYVVTAGLLVHFVMKFVRFLMGAGRRNPAMVK